MRTFRTDESLPAEARGAAVALGNFDGVHLGHQAVIDAARAVNAPLAVATFAPHPRRFFAPDTPPFALQTPSQQARALSNLGVERLFTIPFDAALSQMSERAFVERVLVGQLGVVHVSTGADFRYGAKRAGDVESLRRCGDEFGFTVAAVAPVAGADGVYSSTAVRDAIGGGDMARAATVLSRPWAIEGVVERGFQRGRELGVPTANVRLSDYVRPRLGVYAVRVDIGGRGWWPGVASIGVNPTVGELPEPLLEAHVLEFDGDLYGRRIEVRMLAFLRDEAKFDSLEALKAQMKQDMEDARRALAR
ncbi:bifunctional riboflavin kinase/FAD synthetase [Terricaulis sp.]|uniref:bifunctional riboflavin kinase/FAD synthetase n=1 Tax=Terricaulis sp. TaxID=2768686 RepID=UPI00378307E1